MKLTKIEQILELKHVVQAHFGVFPENIVIESSDLVNECISQLSSTNQSKEVFDFKVFGVTIINEYKSKTFNNE